MTTVTPGTLLAFAVTCLVIELTPGPNMAYLAMLSATKGRRAGFAATLGVALGLLVIGLAAALGLTALIANSRMLYESATLGRRSVSAVACLRGLARRARDITRHSHSRGVRFQVFSARTRHQSAQP